jgi:hypothetical protein
MTDLDDAAFPSKTELLALMVSSITPLHGHHGKRSLYCWGLFTERLYSNGRGTDHTENSYVIVTSLADWRADCCLATNYKHSSYCWVRLRDWKLITGRCLETFWSSTLQYVYIFLLVYTDRNFLFFYSGQYFHRRVYPYVKYKIFQSLSALFVTCNLSYKTCMYFSHLIWRLQLQTRFCIQHLRILWWKAEYLSFTAFKVWELY